MNAQALAEKLRALVLAQDFGALQDHHHGALPIAHFPTIDLAVVAFPEGGAPVHANVLFSREHPRGLVADIAPGAGPVQNLRYLRDFTDAQFESPAWRRDADWSRMDFAHMAGEGAIPFLEPYPASLVKMMVAVGIAHEQERGRLGWDDQLEHDGRARSINDWCEAMITESCNIATEACVKALHACGAIRRTSEEMRQETRNEVELHLWDYGLSTLRLSNTKPNGGWRIPDGAGVGQLCMTAWDAARLFWLLDPAAPPAPWHAHHAPFLSAANLARIGGMLERQGLHIVLSSGTLAGMPGHAAGIPARLAPHWIMDNGSCRVTSAYTYPPDVRPANAAAEVSFAHKTGGTDNYCADAGYVKGLDGRRRHYVVALLSNIGKRYADRPYGVANWKLATLGRGIDDLMRDWLEAGA